MTINSIERVDENHIKINATPDSSALSDEILSVKVDDQHTFVCMNDPSEVAFSLTPPSGETSFIGTSLSLENTPFLVDKDLLFFFITSQKVVANPTVYKVYQYKHNETADINEWVVLTAEEIAELTTIDRTEYRFDVNVTDPDTEWSSYATLGYTIKVIEKEAETAVQTMVPFYNQEVLYKSIYGSLRGILNGKQCCNADYSVEGRLVILLRAFEMALSLPDYRGAIGFWHELHMSREVINQPCNCNG